MAPKLGDIVFIKVTDQYSGTFGVEPAIVTETYDSSDGEWAASGDVVKVRSFSPGTTDIMGLQTGPAAYDDDEIWTDGYALTPDGPEVESLSKQVQPVNPNVAVQAPSGVSEADVQAAIQANNATLVQQILAAQASSAPVSPVAPASTTTGDDVLSPDPTTPVDPTAVVTPQQPMSAGITPA